MQMKFEREGTTTRGDGRRRLVRIRSVCVPEADGPARRWRRQACAEGRGAHLQATPRESMMRAEQIKVSIRYPWSSAEVENFRVAVNQKM